MLCPKCHYDMEQVECGDVKVDRCTECKGLWFGHGVAESLSQHWIAEFLDTGDPALGAKMDEFNTIACPTCSAQMERHFEFEKFQLFFERCNAHGTFFDAGEFTLWAENQYL